MNNLSQDAGVELSQASALSLSHLADAEEPLSQVRRHFRGSEAFLSWVRRRFRRCVFPGEEAFLVFS